MTVPVNNLAVFSSPGRQGIALAPSIAQSAAGKIRAKVATRL